MSWPVAALADVVDFKRFTVAAEDIDDGSKYVGLEHIEGTGGLVNVGQVAEGELESSKFRFTSRQILFGKLRPYLRKVARPDFDGVCSTDILPLTPTSALDRDYLFHALRRQDFIDLATARASGANLPRIAPGVLAEMQIPLPPLPEQRRIAAILDKADALRAKRRDAIAKHDPLLQSVFLDMFGDPVTNPKGWPIRAIAELATVLRDGPFGSNLKSEHYKSSGVRVIRLQNIGVWEFLAADAAYISEEHYAGLPRNHCKAGDVLIGTLGDPNLRACILPPTIKRALNKADCLLFRPEPTRATAEYMCGLLNSPSLIESAAGLALGQTRLRISMGRLKELSVPMPPLPEQQRFTSFCSRFHEQTSTVARQEKYQRELFEALQQAAFSGSL